LKNTNKTSNLTKFSLTEFDAKIRKYWNYIFLLFFEFQSNSNIKNGDLNILTHEK